MRKFSALLAIIAVLMLAIVPVAAQDEETPTIVDIVVSSAEGESPEFTVLLAAVQAADPAIAEALSDPEGIYTVFAPTDEAFGALLEALEVSAEDLLANTDLLNEVLLYHVVPGAFPAEDVVAFDGALLGTVLPGTALSVSVTDEGVFVDDSTVINTDIGAANGIIHVIDTVLLPPAEEDMMDEEMAEEEDMMEEMLSIAETVIAATEGDEPQFTILLQAVVAAGVDGILTNNGPFTVFAPTDEAFGALLEALEVSAEDLLADTDLLLDVLGYHVVPGTFYAEDVLAAADMMEGEFDIATALGQAATISFDGENVFIDGATVIQTDIEASNGVIHVIDSVILPDMGE
jgi:transforming growth factor-beta-induced protein